MFEAILRQPNTEFLSWFRTYTHVADRLYTFHSFEGSVFIYVFDFRKIKLVKLINSADESSSFSPNPEILRQRRAL